MSIAMTAPALVPASLKSVILNGIIAQSCNARNYLRVYFDDFTCKCEKNFVTTTVHNDSRWVKTKASKEISFATLNSIAKTRNIKIVEDAKSFIIEWNDSIIRNLYLAFVDQLDKFKSAHIYNDKNLSLLDDTDLYISQNNTFIATTLSNDEIEYLIEYATKKHDIKDVRRDEMHNCFHVYAEGWMKA